MTDQASNLLTAKQEAAHEIVRNCGAMAEKLKSLLSDSPQEATVIQELSSFFEALKKHEVDSYQRMGELVRLFEQHEQNSYSDHPTHRKNYQQFFHDSGLLGMVERGMAFGAGDALVRKIL